MTNSYRILEDRVTAELLIMDYIGNEGLTANDFTQKLIEAESEGVKKFKVKINSLGGDVFEGIGIYNALAERDVITCIEGMAASAASFVAMAGKKRIIYDNSFLMIHNPSVGGWGDADYFERVQKNLKMIKDAIMKAYSRTGLKEEEIAKMMDDETWMSAEEAFAKNFVDEIIQSNQNPVNKHFAMIRYYNTISKQDERKVNAMLKIQNALGLPGANEDELVNSIAALKKSKQDSDKELADLKLKNQATEQSLADLKKEKEELDKKLKTAEDKEQTAAAEKEDAELEAILNQAEKDGKLVPAMVEKKEQKDALKAILKTNKKYFDLMPVVGPIGSPKTEADQKNLRPKNGLRDAVKKAHEKVVGK